MDGSPPPLSLPSLCPAPLPPPAAAAGQAPDEEGEEEAEGTDDVTALKERLYALLQRKDALKAVPLGPGWPSIPHSYT